MKLTHTFALATLAALFTAPLYAAAPIVEESSYPYSIAATTAYGTDQQSFVSSDALVQLAQPSEDLSIVLGLRSLYHFDKSHGGYEISSGLGLRELMNDNSAYSIDVIYDFTKTFNKTDLSQLSLVTALFQDDYALRVNGYKSLSGTKVLNRISTSDKRVVYLQEEALEWVELYGGYFFMNRALELNIGAGLSSFTNWPSVKAQYKLPITSTGSTRLTAEFYGRYDMFSVHKLDNGKRSRDRLYAGVALRYTTHGSAYKGMRSVLIQPMDHFQRDPDALVTVTSVALASEQEAAQLASGNTTASKLDVQKDFSHSALNTHRAIATSATSTSGYINSSSNYYNNSSSNYYNNSSSNYYAPTTTTTLGTIPILPLPTKETGVQKSPETSKSREELVGDNQPVDGELPEYAKHARETLGTDHRLELYLSEHYNENPADELLANMSSNLPPLDTKHYEDVINMSKNAHTHNQRIEQKLTAPTATPTSAGSVQSTNTQARSTTLQPAVQSATAVQTAQPIMEAASQTAVTAPTTAPVAQEAMLSTEPAITVTTEAVASTLSTTTSDETTAALQSTNGGLAAPTIDVTAPVESTSSTSGNTATLSLVESE